MATGSSQSTSLGTAVSCSLSPERAVYSVGFLVVKLQQAEMSTSFGRRVRKGAQLRDDFDVVALVDKKSRKFLLKIGTGGIMVALAAAALVFYGFESKRVDVRDKAQAALCTGGLNIPANEATLGPAVATTQFAEIAPLVIEHVKRQTPLAVALIQQAACEIDRLGAALAAQSLNNSLPCSLLGGLAPFVEPWLGESLRSRLVRRESDSVSGALLMIRKAVQDKLLAETGGR